MPRMYGVCGPDDLDTTAKAAGVWRWILGKEMAHNVPDMMLNKIVHS